jgi:hypothetical protein
VLRHDPRRDLRLELAQDRAAALLELVLDGLDVPGPRGVRPVLLLLPVLGLVPLLQLVVAKRAGDEYRRVVGAVQLLRVDDDRLRRLLLGQVLAVGAQDRAPQAGQDDDVALLRGRLVRERGRVDDLDLSRPDHDDGKRSQRERQHEPQPAVRRPLHGAGRPPDACRPSRTCFVVIALACTIP